MSAATGVELEIYAALAAVLGLLVGSFLNVVIYRVPKIMEAEWAMQSAAYQAQLHGKEYQPDSVPRFNLMYPPSTCLKCGHRIRWYENIPVLSWLFLRGRCSSCKTPISVRYPLIEIATAILGWYCVQRYGWNWSALAWFGFGACLICLTLIDWDTTYLPDDLTLPLLWAGLLAATLGWTNVSPSNAIAGAVAGYMSLWLVYWAFKLLMGKEGMGYGDFKLFAALGAWFGALSLLPIIILASLLGSIIGIVLKMKAQLREGNQYIPFGPFLALGGFAVWWIGGDTILNTLFGVRT